MRPRLLTISAFGPFAGTETVDFTRLEGKNLLLIEGPTGAGKTSLLDAMTFALFGSVPGARHEVEDSLRSGWADARATCEVSFEWALGERIYRVRRLPAQERAKKRGTGTVKQAPEAHLCEVVDGRELPLCAPKLSEVDAAVGRLLGLSVEQFKQVLLLPQGEFRQFLLAKSTDKEPLLEQLFGTSLYKEAAERLGTERRALEKRLGELERAQKDVLAQRGVESDAQLAQAVEEARERVAAADAVAERAAGLAARAGERHAAAVAVATRLLEREAARAQLGEARGAQAQAEPRRAALAEAERAEPVRQALARVELERDRATKLAEHAKLAEAARAQAVERAVALEQAAAELPALAQELEALARRDAVLAELEPAAQQLAEAETARAAAEQAGQAAGQRLAVLDRNERETKAATAELSEPLQRAHAATQALAELTTEAARCAERARRRNELTVAQGKLLAARDKLGQFEAHAIAARAKVDAARNSVQVRRAAREANLAAELAANLIDGSPCPVCGSPAHPAPAAATARAIGPELVAEAERMQADAERLAGEIERVFAGAGGELAQHAQRAAELEETLSREQGGALEPADVVTAAARRAEQARQQAAAIAAEAPALVAKRDRLAAVLEQLQQERRVAEAAAGEAALARDKASALVDDRRTRLAAQLPDGVTLAAARTELGARRKERATRLSTLEAELASARAGRESTQTLAERAQVQAAEQTITLGEAAQAADAAAHALGLGDAAEAAHRLLEPERRQAWRAELDELARRVAGAEQRASAAEAALAGSDMAALADAGDLPARQSEAQLAGQEAHAAAVRLGELRTAAEELEKARALVEQRAAQYGALDAQLRTLGQLARMVAGDNPLNMSLGRYVLAARMEEVAVAASERLWEMSRGRYRLRRTDYVRHGGRGSGLDLVVDDSFTGVERAVHSLSGGEMFLASLALAMGLADVVQSHAGGIRLDSLFIDEGFGSLDDETLDMVMRTLEDLRAGGRLIGLISHVSELKERLSTRLTVVKGARGSTTRMVV